MRQVDVKAHNYRLAIMLHYKLSRIFPIIEGVYCQKLRTYKHVYCRKLRTLKHVYKENLQDAP